MRVGLAAAIGRPQKRDVEQQLVRDSEELDCEAEPDPSDLVPCTARRQHRFDKAPVEIACDNQPHDGKYQETRPPALKRQQRTKDIDRAHNEQHWPEKLDERQSIGKQVTCSLGR